MTNYVAWLRAQIGPHMIPLAATTALIRDEQGRILCQHRADFKHAWWGLPGGVLEPGETLQGAIVREVLEETGLHVEPIRLSGVYSSPRYIVHYPNGDVAHQVTACYECRIVGGALRPDADEILHLEFFPSSALPPFPLWYADMIAHALQPLTSSYFDPPEQQIVETPYSSLMATRAVVGHAPLVWPGASAVVRDQAGQILLQQRGDNELWGLPAGALDTGESVAHTVVRETLEETGLLVEPIRLTGVYAGWRSTYPNGDELYPVVHNFECRVISGNLHPDGHESLEVGFFAPDQLPPLSPNFRRRIEQALGIILP